MNDINIPLKKRIVKIVFLIVIVTIFSIIYFITNLKSMDNEVQMYKEKSQDWRTKIIQTRNLINKINRKIEDEINKSHLVFSKEEINEIEKIYQFICDYIYQKNNLKCSLRGITKSQNYINVINVLISTKTKDFKNTLLIANILSYLTNNFISYKTTIKLKDIKILNKNLIIIELFKKETKNDFFSKKDRGNKR